VAGHDSDLSVEDVVLRTAHLEHCFTFCAFQ